MALERYLNSPSVSVGGGVDSVPDKNQEFEEENIDEIKDIPEQTTKEEKPEKSTINITFNDIENHWAKNYITTLVEKNIIKGKTETRFAPDDNITRAEFITLLYRLSGDSSINTICFDDVSVKDWHYDAISWAVKNGIAMGISDTSFLPDENISREQAVVFIARYLEYKKVLFKEQLSEEFADEDIISQWAKQAVKNVKNLGIISGKKDNMFAPMDNTTRGETAKIIVNLMNVIDKYEK